MNEVKNKRFWLYSIFSLVALAVTWVLIIFWAIFAYSDYHQKVSYWLLFSALIIAVSLCIPMSFTCLEFTDNEVTVVNRLIPRRATYILQHIEIFIEEPVSLGSFNNLYYIRLAATTFYGKDRYVICGKFRQEDFAKFARKNDIKITDRRLK